MSNTTRRDPTDTSRQHAADADKDVRLLLSSDLGRRLLVHTFPRLTELADVIRYAVAYRDDWEQQVQISYLSTKGAAEVAAAVGELMTFIEIVRVGERDAMWKLGFRIPPDAGQLDEGWFYALVDLCVDAIDRTGRRPDPLAETSPTAPAPTPTWPRWLTVAVHNVARTAAAIDASSFTITDLFKASGHSYAHVTAAVKAMMDEGRITFNGDDKEMVRGARYCLRQPTTVRGDLGHAA